MNTYRCIRLNSNASTNFALWFHLHPINMFRYHSVLRIIWNPRLFPWIPFLNPPSVSFTAIFTNSLSIPLTLSISFPPGNGAPQAWGKGVVCPTLEVLFSFDHVICCKAIVCLVLLRTFVLDSAFMAWWCNINKLLVCNINAWQACPVLVLRVLLGFVAWNGLHGFYIKSIWWL